MKKPQRKKVTFIEFHPFYQCCVRAVEQLEAAETELTALMDDTKSSCMSPAQEEKSLVLQHEIDMHELSAPIFAATTAESFINSYSESSIGKKAFESPERLDELGLLSKWIVVPYVASGVELNRHSDQMLEFQELIRVRNALVHSKPTRSYNVDDSQIEKAGLKFDNRTKDRRRIAKRSALIVRNLVSALVSVDKTKQAKMLAKELRIPVA